MPVGAVGECRDGGRGAGIAPDRGWQRQCDMDVGACIATPPNTVSFAARRFLELVRAFDPQEFFDRGFDEAQDLAQVPYRIGISDQKIRAGQ